MVVAARISYIRSLLSHGAKVVCTVSLNRVTCVEKVKVIVDPAIHVCTVQPGAEMMLDYLEHSSTTAHVADRGHKHSKGQSEIVFYISRPSSKQSGSAMNVPRNATMVREQPQPFVDAVELVGEWERLPDSGWRAMHMRFEAFRIRDAYSQGPPRLGGRHEVHDPQLQTMLVEIWPTIKHSLRQYGFDLRRVKEACHRHAGVF
jgi:hypothetical protein